MQDFRKCLQTNVLLLNVRQCTFFGYVQLKLNPDVIGRFLERNFMVWCCYNKFFLYSISRQTAINIDFNIVLIVNIKNIICLFLGEEELLFMRKKDH